MDGNSRKANADWLKNRLSVIDFELSRFEEEYISRIKMAVISEIRSVRVLDTVKMYEELVGYSVASQDDRELIQKIEELKMRILLYLLSDVPVVLSSPLTQGERALSGLLDRYPEDVTESLLLVVFSGLREISRQLELSQKTEATKFSIEKIALKFSALKVLLHNYYKLDPQYFNGREKELLLQMRAQQKGITKDSKEFKVYVESLKTRDRKLILKGITLLINKAFASSENSIGVEQKELHLIYTHLLDALSSLPFKKDDRGNYVMRSSLLLELLETLNSLLEEVLKKLDNVAFHSGKLKRLVDVMIIISERLNEDYKLLDEYTRQKLELLCQNINANLHASKMKQIVKELPVNTFKLSVQPIANEKRMSNVQRKQGEKRQLS